MAVVVGVLGAVTIGSGLGTEASVDVGAVGSTHGMRVPADAGTAAVVAVGGGSVVEELDVAASPAQAPASSAMAATAVNRRMCILHLAPTALFVG